ncbi:MAG: hypothetical protein HOF72_00710, partial [Planctomycetaceae bacterium]|nr:hypothetical protein [Planctomycetaceae bacterium]
GGVDGLEDPLTVVSNDLRGHTGIINHTISTADENFSNLALSGISANVGDADSPGIMILETGTGTSVAESNNLGLQSIDAYDVILTMAPIENITITITPDPPKEDAFTAGARGIEVRKQGTTTFSDTLQLTFTPANWNISQTVEIQAQADVDQNNISIDVVEGTQNYVIKHTVIQGVDAGDEDAYDGLPIPSVLAEVIDTDAKDVVVRIGDISSDLVDAPWLHEAVELGGMTATYVVALTQVPSDTVSIVLTNTPDVTYSTNALVFTTANWETPQAVTVTVVDDLDKEGNHFATISHTISSNDDTYAAIGKFNVEFPVSDDDQPEILILPSTSTVNVIEPTTTKVVYDGVVSSATINSITMPSLVQDISSFSLGNNRSLWSSSNLSSTNRIQNWSTQPNSDIDNSTTRPHVTVDGVGSGNFAYYQFSVTSDMLSDGNGSVLGTFDIDGGKNSLQGSFDPYLYLYKQNLGFFGFPTATLLTSNDDSSVDAGSLHRYDSKIINYNFTSPGIYVVRVGRYPRNSTVPQGATYQLHVSLEHHNNNDNNLPTTNTFDGNTIVITSGTGKGQERTIAASNGLSGNTITVTSNWDDTPDVTSRFAVRKTIAGVATNTGHDQYTIVLTAAPTSDVTVNLVPQATKTYNDVLKFDESQNKGQRTAKQIFANTPSLTFTNSNWHVPQTITVSGITDNHIDGDAAISFPDAKRQVTDIRGPLSINGFEPDGQERDLEDPLLVPGELNLPPPDGAIVSAGDDDDNRAYITISGLPQNPYCITAVDWDLSTLTDDNQRRICSSKSDGTKYPGLPRNDWDQVDNIIGFEFTILGDIGNEATFIVSAPSDLSDPYEDDPVRGVSTTGFTIHFTEPWSTYGIDPANLGLTDENGDYVDKFFYQDRNANLDVNENDQVDKVIVHNQDSLATSAATLRRNLFSGLGMGADTTIEGRKFSGGITYDNIESLNVNLGTGTDTLLIESTHAGVTNIDAGQGYTNTINVLSTHGHTIITTGGAADEVTTGTLTPNALHDNDASIDRIGGLLVITGNGAGDTLDIQDTSDNDTIANNAILTSTDFTGLDMPRLAEVQRLVVKSTGGDFVLKSSDTTKPVEPQGSVTLSFDANPIDFTADANSIATALNSFYGTNNDILVQRFGDTFLITFDGVLTGENMANLVWDELHSDNTLQSNLGNSVQVNVDTIVTGTTDQSGTCDPGSSDTCNPAPQNLLILDVPATSGSYQLTLQSTKPEISQTTASLAWNASSSEIQTQLSTILDPNNIHDDKSHTNNIDVIRSGTAYILLLQGEHATSDISITQTNSTLNQPLTITKRQDGIHYRDIETLQLWLSENE